MVYTVDYEKLLWIYWYILIIWKHIVWHLKYETVDTYGGLRGYINVSKQCGSYIYIYYILYIHIYIYHDITKEGGVHWDWLAGPTVTGRLSSQLGTESKIFLKDQRFWQVWHILNHFDTYPFGSGMLWAKAWQRRRIRRWTFPNSQCYSCLVGELRKNSRILPFGKLT
jgi:hypothetical protein